jgi:hypothetical protein
MQAAKGGILKKIHASQSAPALEQEVVLEVQPAKFGVGCDGVKVKSVASGSQAQKLGVKVGWTIAQVAGKDMGTSGEITKALAAGLAGNKPYKIKFRAAVAAAAAAAAAETVPTAAAASAGGDEKVIEVDPKPFGIKCDADVKVLAVTAGSQAATKGVQVGWQVVEVSGKRMASPGDVTKALMAGKASGKTYKVKFRTGASSTKLATAQGHHVTTVATSEGATAAAPAEPDAKAAEETAAAVAAAEAAAAAAETAAAAAEAERVASSNGEVVLKYEMYDERFVLRDGQLGPGGDGGLCGASYIDEEYCLSFVMPNCKIHLATVDRREVDKMADCPEKWQLFAQEDPPGTFRGLRRECSYWVVIVEDSAQARKDQERMAKVWAALDTEQLGLIYLAAEGKMPASGKKLRGADGKMVRDEQTEQLYSLSAEEIQAGGSKYQQLLAERDLKESGYG